MYQKTFTAYFNDFHKTLFGILLPSRQTFSQAKPNLIIVSQETSFIKNSYHTETIQLIYKARPLIGFDTSFYRRVFQNKVEQTFFPRKSEFIAIILTVSNNWSTQSINIVLVYRVYSKSVFKTFQKREITQLSQIFKPLRKNVIRNLNLQQRNIKIWHKSNFCNQNFAVCKNKLQC